nr:Chain A, Major prion protein [Mus musculus]
QYSNQNNFV